MANPTVLGKSDDRRSTHRGLRNLSPVARAWISIGFVPLFVLIGYTASVGVLGHLVPVADPVTGEFRVWADNLQTALFVAIVLTPSISSIVYGRRAVLTGVRRGALPVLLGVLVCAATALVLLLAITLQRSTI